MTRLISPIEQVDMVGKLADMKDQQYRNTLVLSAVIELLIEKGLLSRSEIEAKAARLDGLIPHPARPIR
jgi:hypothetical protein